MTGEILLEFLYWWYTLMLDAGPDAALLDLTEWLGWLIALGACGNLPCWA